MANPNLPGAEDTREPFAAFLLDDDTASVVVPIAEEYGWPKKRVQRGSLENAIRSLGIIEPPKLLVVDLGKGTSKPDEIHTIIEACQGQSFIIAVGETNDVKFYRDLMAAGVNDYLLKPITREVMAGAISRGFIAINEPEKGRRPGGVTQNKMTTIVGVRGGLGASTLSTTLAWISAQEFQRTTAILDLDIHFGTSALTFDLEPGRGLADALEDPTRIDELFIERAMISVGKHLSILGSEMPFEEPFTLDPRALSHLIGTLKHKVNYLYVDLPRNMVGDQVELLEESDTILLVSELALAATRDTIRFLAYLRNVSPKAKVKLVVVPSHLGGAEEVSLKDFEASVETKVDYKLPTDNKTILNAVKQGKVLPQVAKNSPLVNIMREITLDVTGLKSAPKKKAGGWLTKGK